MDLWWNGMMAKAWRTLGAILRHPGRGKAWPANRLGTSRSTVIFNLLATTPVHVRYVLFTSL
jgi:hypothetical protein